MVVSGFVVTVAVYTLPGANVFIMVQREPKGHPVSLGTRSNAPRGVEVLLRKLVMKANVNLVRSFSNPRTLLVEVHVIDVDVSIESVVCIVFSNRS